MHSFNQVLRKANSQFLSNLVLCSSLVMLFALFLTPAHASQEWVRCANEGEICDVPALATIRYGADGHYASVTDVSYFISCSNHIFGDPVSGVFKYCDYQLQAANEPPNDDVQWISCATEGGHCVVPSLSTVRYGANDTYVSVTDVTTAIACSNAVFGDPLWGVTKSCQYQLQGEPIIDSDGDAIADVDDNCPSTPNPDQLDSDNNGIGNACELEQGQWIVCATEGQSCALPDSAIVRYGAEGSYTTLAEIEGVISCSNATFGDPIWGVVKACEYQLLNNESGSILSVNIESGQGSVIGITDSFYCEDDCSEVVENNQVVSLSASPDNGYQFVGWSGDCGGQGSCVIQIGGDTLVSAHFIPVATSEIPVCDAMDECWYASPDGIGNTCSFAQPCSIETAGNYLSGGDILYLLPGVYSETYAHYERETIINFGKFYHFQEPLPTKINPVTVKSYIPQQAIIQGDYSEDCITVEREGVHFDGLVVRQCFRSGIRVSYDIAAHHIHIRNSLFEEIAGNDNMGGVFVHSSRGVVIENNTFRDHYYLGTKEALLSPQCRGFGLIYFRAADMIVRNNTIYRTCQGMYFKHGEAEVGLGGFTHISGNRIYDVYNGGIDTNQNRTEIFDNLLINTSIGIHPNQDGTLSPNTTDTVVRNNTIINGNLNIGRVRSSPSIGGLRTTVKNNIFYNSDYFIWVYGRDENYEQGIDLISDANCFYQEVGLQSIDYFSADGVWGDAGGQYLLSDFQSIEGFDQGSLEADPQFLDVNSGDYRIAADSPCAAINAGAHF